MASLRWHPLYGDRSSSIVAISYRAEPARIRWALSSALLTDDELSEGQRGWDRFTDPFGVAHADPCQDVLDERALLAGTDPPIEWFKQAEGSAGQQTNPERKDKS